MGDKSDDEAAPMEGSPTGCAHAVTGATGMASAAQRLAIAPRFAIEQMDGIFLRFISL
jgi:hypothetical protein